MTPTMTQLRAEWRETIITLTKQIEFLEQGGRVAKVDEDPEVATAAWLLKLRKFRDDTAELLAMYPGD